MKKYIGFLTVSLLAALISVSQAEARIWTDIDGTKLEAELIENMHGHVSLRAKDNKIVHVSISHLCADDQKYVLRNTPPDIAVDVVEITDRHNKSFGGGRYDDGVQVEYGSLQFKAKLTKSSTIPYEGKMTAELYIIGSQSTGGHYGLLDKKVIPFSFEAKGGDSFEFRSDNVNIRQFEAGGTMGAEYEGYLVVLLDAKGNVFKIKGSRSMFEEHAETIRKQGKGDIIKQDAMTPLRPGLGYDDDNEGRPLPVVRENAPHGGRRR